MAAGREESSRLASRARSGAARARVRLGCRLRRLLGVWPSAHAAVASSEERGMPPPSGRGLADGRGV